MFAQYLPGKPNYYRRAYKTVASQGDGTNDRIRYFQMCLSQIDDLALDVVAMPYFIGCGLAGGEWGIYKAILEASKTNIILYKI